MGFTCKKPPNISNDKRENKVAPANLKSVFDWNVNKVKETTTTVVKKNACITIDVS